MPDAVAGTVTTRVEDLMDVYQSSRTMRGINSAFEFPDYDRFFATGPGMGGELGLHLFDFGTLQHKNTDDFEYCSSSVLSNEFRPFTKTPKMLFKHQSLTQTQAPYYGNSYDPYGPILQVYGQMNNGNPEASFWILKIVTALPTHAPTCKTTIRLAPYR